MKKKFVRITTIGIIGIILFYFIIWNTELYYVLEEILNSEMYGAWIGMIGIVFFIKLIIKIIFCIPNDLKDFFVEFLFTGVFSIIGFELFLAITSIINLINFDS